MARKKINKDLVGKILFDSQFKCCVCEDDSRGDQIHHIDGNSSNNDYNNLAFLCFKHHSDASGMNHMRKQLTPKAIVKFRDNWYKQIKEKRNAHNKVKGNSITHKGILNAALDANIILEIIKIEDQYHNANWKSKGLIVNNLCKYRNHLSLEVCIELLSFFLKVSGEARFKELPKDVASSIYYQVSDMVQFSILQKRQVTQRAVKCIEIAENLIYYSSISELINLGTAAYGYNILKALHMEGRRTKHKTLISKVSDSYDNLTKAIHSAKHNPEIKKAELLLNSFKKDLGSPVLTFPMFPSAIRSLVLK